MRRTRIIATIGPASNDAATVLALIQVGTNAFRLNFSHGTPDTHRATCRLIRETAAAAGLDVSILQDLGGPKIRTGRVTGKIPLTSGAPLVIERGDFLGEPGRVSCTFGALFESVTPGCRLLIDDGKIELEVVRADSTRLETVVVEGGLLESGKGINVPSVSLRTSALTEKDRADLIAGLAMGIDMVAVSFVQSPDDVRDARQVATEAGAPDLPIIAKIEKPQAVACIDAIVAVSDGLLVARGDLGVEIPLEQVPAVQRRVIKAARRVGVPVILATQVLESMRTEPRPTRAEVTDAAHAVDERVDAILLTGETASGLYPVRSVAVLDTIVREAEKAFTESSGVVPEGASWNAHGRALCEAAVALADSAGARTIVALSRAGKTARFLAAMRPAARLLAITPSPQLAARLALVWGVAPVVTDVRAIGAVRDVLESRGLVDAGDVIVFVSAHAELGHENINFVHVERV